MKKLMTFLVLSVSFFTHVATLSAQNDDPLDMIVLLFNKCTKDSIYRDSLNHIRSNNSILDDFLLDMKPQDFYLYDSLGYELFVDLQWFDLQISQDSFNRKVLQWLDTINYNFKIRSGDDSCVRFTILKGGRLSTKNADFKIYYFSITPNPGRLIYAIKGGQCMLNIYNTSGQLLYSQKIISLNGTVELDAPPGVYYFQIEHKNKIETHKIIHSP